MSLSIRADIDAGKFFVSYSQDYITLAVGSKNGYRLFELNEVDNKLDLIHSSGEGVCLLERHSKTPYVNFVSRNDPGKLTFCRFKIEQRFVFCSHSNTILAVRHNSRRLVVCLEKSLHIYDVRTNAVVHIIEDTPPNTTGICALTGFPPDPSYLAYPGSATAGNVQIFDVLNSQVKTMIPAHKSPLAALVFSPGGMKLATASKKGTVIRVFSVRDGSKLIEFRLGMFCVSIASLAFSHCSTYLCCSSNLEMVHIFKLERTQPAAERAYATAALAETGSKHACIITTEQKSLRLLVASQDGYLCVYQVPEQRGTCQLLKKHDLRIFEPPLTIQPEALPIDASNASSPSAGEVPSSISGQQSNDTASEDN